MEDNKFRLQIVTPNRQFYDDEAEMIIFKTTEGEIGVLKGHIPLTTTLTSGMAIIKNGDDEKNAVLHGGFAEINEDTVIILTDAAEWPDEIDIERAKAAQQRAEERLKAEDAHASDIRMMKARASLLRALVRLEVAEYHKNNE